MNFEVTGPHPLLVAVWEIHAPPSSRLGKRTELELHNLLFVAPRFLDLPPPLNINDFWSLLISTTGLTLVFRPDDDIISLLCTYYVYTYMLMSKVDCDVLNGMHMAGFQVDFSTKSPWVITSLP